MNTPELRNECAQLLSASAGKVKDLSVFAGLDGFVDEIIRVVDKRDSVDRYAWIPTIHEFARRIAGAAGRSTNLELVPQQIKLGGNGPIMANALAAFGMNVTYVGTLGRPEIHPVFHEFARRVQAFSIGDAGHTDAIEFDDGKLMFGKMEMLKEVTWEAVQERFGRERFSTHFGGAHLVAFVNWTMIPYMSDFWEALQGELCPQMSGPRRWIFFDLADPEKRTREDIGRALEIIRRFERHFDVILGLNEKEAMEISSVLGIQRKDASRQALEDLALEIRRKLPVNTLVIHPVTYALAASDESAAVVDGPFIIKPLITTGAGDHFNAGFCLGKLLGMNNALALLTGVASSGHYVRTARSPSISQLIELMQNWP